MLSAVVAVPTFGRTDLLFRCLESVVAFNPRPREVVVVDGNAEPLQIPFALPRWVRVVREPNRGPAHARNTAHRALAPRADEVVCFLDDDAVAPRDWVRAHVECHAAQPRAGAVGGAISNLTSGSIASEHLHRTSFAPLRADEGPVRFVPSVNISYKQACLAEVGLFDTSLTEAAGEDVDHCARIVAAGWEVWFTPAIEVGHHYPTSVRGLLRKQRSYGRGFSRTRALHPDLPGADFLAKGWARTLLGTVPHVARECVAAARDLGWRHGPLEAACQIAYRSGAAAERTRLRRTGAVS